VDEESKKELEEIQAKGNSVTSATESVEAMKNFDMAGWLAGKTK
jgi:hypothetical protein